MEPRGRGKPMAVPRATMLEHMGLPVDLQEPLDYAPGLESKGLRWREFDICLQVLEEGPWQAWALITTKPKGGPSLEEVSRVCQELGDRIEKLEKTVKELTELITSRPVIKYTFIYDLGDENLSVKEPVPVTIEEYEDEFVATVPELDCFGSAETEGEAIAVLKTELVRLYKDLAATPAEQLGKLPKAWLRVLHRLVGAAGDT